MGLGILTAFRRAFGKGKLTPSREAYDLWSEFYDTQPGNLMIDLDEAVFGKLLATTGVKAKCIVDLGCGTGRHWKTILDRQPARLLGFDSSTGMLEKLKEKFSGAEAFLSTGPFLPVLEGNSVDLLISTLTLAHIEDPAPYFLEWNRVLRPGGEIILTDYHPAALGRGAKRTFRHRGETIAILNHVHPIARVREFAALAGFTELRLVERRIDESVRSYYEDQRALNLFRQFLGTPIIYGIHLKKPDDIA